MSLKGRQPYAATVHGTVDGVPFTNYFKYLGTAKRNATDGGDFTLTVISSGHQYRFSQKRQEFYALDKDAPPLP